MGFLRSSPLLNHRESGGVPRSGAGHYTQFEQDPAGIGLAQSGCASATYHSIGTVSAERGRISVGQTGKFFGGAEASADP